MIATSAPAKEWSPYQEELFRFGTEDSRSGMVIAVAGSGKTTTIEELCRRLPPNEQICYLVFNKKNAVEAQARMPSNVNASTFHSACNGALRKRLGNLRLEQKKTLDIVKEMNFEGAISDSEFRDFGYALTRLVGLGKNSGVDVLVPNDAESWQGIIDHYGLDFPMDPEQWTDKADVEDRVIELAIDVLDVSNDEAERNCIIDFDDMLYLAVKYNAALPQYGVVCVDEAQDTNDIQRALLRRMTRGRLIAVGDPKQAIYGFRGANADAMELIRGDFGCVDLPLSINYRCGKAIVKAAKRYCPEIQAWDRAIEGSVTSPSNVRLVDFRQTDAVLCRTTAPLITLAYRLLSNGIGCTVLGRDIGQGLVTLVKRMKADDIKHLEKKLDKWREREYRRWTEKGEDEKAQAALDKVSSIRAAISSLSDAATIDELIAHIEGLFSDTGEGRLTLATVHKAKGLEWPRVFILNHDRMPSKWATKSWQLEQEYNLIYVAYTRAKEALVFLGEPDSLG